MTTPAALYYPHTNITDKSIIKNSLLLWDQVEYITPAPKWTHDRFPSKAFNDAIDIISKPHYPTNEERKEVHNRISELIKNGLPDWFMLDVSKTVDGSKTYPIYPDKLDHQTWMMLEDHHLVRFNKHDLDFHTTPFFGLMVMSLLADACAGNLKRKITDRSDAYSVLQKFMTTEAGGKYITDLNSSMLAPQYEKLVTLSIKVLNSDDVPISALVAMRKREQKSPSKDYRNFRINYLSKIDEYIERLNKPGLREGDIQEIERQFQLDLETDLRELRRELNLTTRKLLISKEIGIAVVALANAFTGHITGLTDLSPVINALGVGALGKVGLDYQPARKKALASSSMSWLYLAEKKASGFDPKKIII
jgi:hypothetical protein